MVVIDSPVAQVRDAAEADGGAVREHAAEPVDDPVALAVAAGRHRHRARLQAGEADRAAERIDVTVGAEHPVAVRAAAAGVTGTDLAGVVTGSL